MSGFKLLHSLRMGPNRIEVPTVVLTGRQEPELEEKASRWGVKRVLHKPIRQKHVVAVVREIIENN